MRIILLILLVSYSLNLQAYLGPGMGGGLIAAIIGFFMAILLALWGILYFPIKRYLKKRKKQKNIKNKQEKEKSSNNNE